MIAARTAETKGSDSSPCTRPAAKVPQTSAESAHIVEARGRLHMSRKDLVQHF